MKGRSIAGKRDSVEIICLFWIQPKDFAFANQHFNKID